MVASRDKTYAKRDREYALMYGQLQNILHTFGRTDGVCVTTQTKQKVLEDTRQLVEQIRNGR